MKKLTLQLTAILLIVFTVTSFKSTNTSQSHFKKKITHERTTK